MKTNSKKGGFTLIELLVVIAIIGILSSIVLASLSTARNKGKQASAIGSMTSMRSQAELTNSNGTYMTSLCTDTSTGLGNLKAAAQAQGASVTCAENSGLTAWAAYADMTSIGGTYFCVDSKGNATTTASSPSTNVTTNYYCF